jgi:hypothetical protein
MPQVSDNFGPYPITVTLDGSGNGSLSFQANGSAIRIANIFFKVATSTLQATVTIYKGFVSEGSQIFNSPSGSTGGNAQGNVDLFDGEIVFVRWVGGDAGAIATATFTGQKIPFQDIKASNLEFTSPIAAGDGSLVFPALKSPNYVAGVTGWKIDRAGNAEFNNADIRGVLQVDGVNNGYVAIDVGTDPDTGLVQAEIIFRPSFTSWLPNADIDTGVIRVYGDSATNLLPSGRISTEIDGAAWSAGSGAANLIPPVLKMSTATYSSGVNPTIELRDENSTNNCDIRLTGNTQIQGASLTVSVPFGRENVALNIVPASLVTSVTTGLAGVNPPLINTFGMWSAGSPNSIVLVRNGLHEAGASVRFIAQGVTAGFRQLYIIVNGSIVSDYILPTTTQMNGFATTVYGTIRFIGAIGDVVTMAALQTSGGNLSTIATSRMWVELIQST